MDDGVFVSLFDEKIVGGLLLLMEVKIVDGDE
jgi:hypothetical protein